jgi:DNA-binding response OmpR family regulator
VLLVDDHDDARDGLTQLIRAEGYGVETARNGREALRVLRDVKPCIILLDLTMPDMTGYDFRRVQLADDDLREIPVILCSATHDLREYVHQLEASAYIEKPLEFTRLMGLIRKNCLK